MRIEEWAENQKSDVFLEFSYRLEKQGILTKEQVQSIEISSWNNTLSSYMKLFLEIEVWFWWIILPTIIYSSRDDSTKSLDALATEMIILSVFATWLRWSLAYWRGKVRWITDPGIFSLIEIIPKIGRLAPILWIPEHREYLIARLLYRKYKDTEFSSEDVLESMWTYQLHIEKISRLRHVLQNTPERIRKLF